MSRVDALTSRYARQGAASALDQVEELLRDIPACADGFVLQPESIGELMRAAVALRHARSLLRSTRRREIERYESWSTLQPESNASGTRSTTGQRR